MEIELQKWLRMEMINPFALTAHTVVNVSLAFCQFVNLVLFS